jgi:hypothetical protein
MNIKTWRPCTLGCRIRPLWMVEVQVLQEQKPAMRHTVSVDGSQSMPLAVNGTAVLIFNKLKSVLHEPLIFFSTDLSSKIKHSSIKKNPACIRILDKCFYTELE